MGHLSTNIYYSRLNNYLQAHIYKKALILRAFSILLSPKVFKFVNQLVPVFGELTY